VQASRPTRSAASSPIFAVDVGGAERLRLSRKEAEWVRPAGRAEAKMEDENRDSSNGNIIKLESAERVDGVICVLVFVCACPAGRIVRLPLSLWHCSCPSDLRCGVWTRRWRNGCCSCRSSLRTPSSHPQLDSDSSDGQLKQQSHLPQSAGRLPSPCAADPTTATRPTQPSRHSTSRTTT